MQHVARVYQRQLIRVQTCERTDRQTGTLIAILRCITRFGVRFYTNYYYILRESQTT